MTLSDLLALCHAPWAIRSEALSAVASLLRAQAGSTEVIEPDPQAAVRGRLSTTGGVAVIPLRGMITPRGSFLSVLFGGGGGLEAFRSAFREALASDEVGSILLDIDSPGGSTDLCDETAAEIRAARGTKPITAIANTDAASAAYYIASQADEVVVTPSGEVGSIGVFMLHWDESALNEQIGIEPTYISAGRYKIEGNPDEPLSDEAKAAFQQTVDEFYEMFVAAVAAGRGVDPEAVRSGFGEGRMVTAERAVALGMADRVATYEQTVQRLAGRPDPSPTNVQTERVGLRALQTARPRHAQKEG